MNTDFPAGNDGMLLHKPATPVEIACLQMMLHRATTQSTLSRLSVVTLLLSLQVCDVSASKAAVWHWCKADGSSWQHH